MLTVNHYFQRETKKIGNVQVLESTMKGVKFLKPTTYINIIVLVPSLNSRPEDHNVSSTQ